MFMSLLVTGLFLTALQNVAFAQPPPITFTIEYQSQNQLNADQEAFRQSVVNAAYRSLQKYVLAKLPTSRLLSEPVCRVYGKLPSPPPRSPRGPRFPDLPTSPLEPSTPPETPPPPPSPSQHPNQPPTYPPIPDAAAPAVSPSRRRLLSYNGETALPYVDTRARVEVAARGRHRTGLLEAGVPAYPPPSQPPPPGQQPNPGPDGTGGGGGGTNITRCYPDFNASSSSPSGDGRLQQCGLSYIMKEHVRDTAAGEAVSLTGGLGEVTDLYLYISSEPDPSWCPPGDDIRASTCLYDTATGRPTMAAINVCPQALDRYDVNTLVSRLLREMLKALGVARVGFFGQAPAAEYRTRMVAQRDSGDMATRFLTTPHVQQAVRQFFACNTVPGALLDDATHEYGADRLYDSSVVQYDGEELLDPDYRDRALYSFFGWETSHFQGDILIADPDPVPASAASPQVTALTLALLQDTTWYDTVPSSAGYWTWGRGRGCDMAAQHCRAVLQMAGTTTYGSDQGGEAPLFCDPGAPQRNSLLCTPGGGATPGTCTASSSFLDPSCGLVTSPTAGLAVCAAREAEIDVLSGGDAAASRTFGWAAGYSSRCVSLQWPWSALAADRTPPAWLSYPPYGGGDAVGSASCFPANCSATGELSVRVYNTWVLCPSGKTLNLTAGGRLSSSYTSESGLRGGLDAGVLGPCPDNAAVCGTLACTPGSCSSQGGECRPAAEDSGGTGGSRCYCRTMYGGKSCEVNLVTEEVEELRPVVFKALEAAVVLSTPLSTVYGSYVQFLAAVADELDGLQQGQALYRSLLSIPRVNVMSSFPSYVAAGGSPMDVQVVVRFLAATALQAELFQMAVAAGLLEAALERVGLAAVANTVSYLGEVELATGTSGGPGSTPTRPPPAPLARDPGSGDGSGGGLSHGEKVAIGVGVSFGTLLLILLGLMIFCIWKHAKEERGQYDRHGEVEMLPRSINAHVLPTTPGARGRGDGARAGGAGNGSAMAPTDPTPTVLVGMQAGSSDNRLRRWWRSMRGAGNETKA